jgi:acetylornithine aminotransferase
VNVSAGEDRPNPILWYPGHELILPDIVRAEGSRLVDAAGKEYLDFESGVWCAAIGHANPRVLRAIAEQGARFGHAGFNYSGAVVEEAAREVLALAGLGGGACVFLCSGSEAIEYGVRAVQSVLDRPLLMTMTDSYFGAYGSASKRAENEWFSFDWAPCAECPSSRTCDEACPHWAAIPRGRIGGFLFEPGSSSGLVRFPPEKVVRSVEKLVRENDGFFLVNEVTTGLRTGEWFGYRRYGVSPDVVAMGKGIGNGYPVSVTAFSPRVIRRLGGRPVKYAQSHQNDPVGAAAVRAVISVIREEGLIERSGTLGAVLFDGLRGIAARTGRVRDVRGRGLMAAVELVDDPACSRTTRAHLSLIRRGFVVGKRPGVSVLRLDPPLTLAREDLDAFLSTFEDVLAETA